MRSGRATAHNDRIHATRVARPQIHVSDIPANHQAQPPQRRIRHGDAIPRTNIKPAPTPTDDSCHSTTRDLRVQLGATCCRCPDRRAAKRSQRGGRHRQLRFASSRLTSARRAARRGHSFRRCTRVAGVEKLGKTMSCAPWRAAWTTNISARLSATETEQVEPSFV